MEKPPAAGQWSIGVIDDEASYRSILEEVFLADERVGRLSLWESAETFWREEAAGELDIIFVDYRLPHMDGVELIRLIHEKFSQLPLVMLTSAASDQVVFRAIQAGAVGYVLKAELEDLVKTTAQILEGGAVVSPTIALKLLSAFQRPVSNEAAVLTTRERQVLEQLVTGAPYPTVAGRLGVSLGTLKVHIRNIYKKLNIKNQFELARKAYEMGLGPGN